MTQDRLPIVEWETDSLRLRLFKEDDFEPLAATCRDPHTQHYLSQLPDPYTLDDAREYATGSAADAWIVGKAQWAIADRDTDDYIGSIGIPRKQSEFKAAEIGYLVAPWARGRGVASEAAAAVTDYLFANGILRAELHIVPSNIASQRVALRAGFVRDAALRGAISTRDGVRHDRLIYSRLANDPPGPKPPILPELAGGQLSDGIVTLRPLRSADADDIFAHLGLSESWRTSVPPIPPSRSSVESLCNYRSTDQWLAGISARMAITDAQSGAVTGSISLSPVPGPTSEAMIGYGLAREHRGRGFATRAVQLISRWAFQEVHMRRIIAGTAIDNHDSMGVLNRAGFTKEGQRRNALPGPDGNRIDDILWSLLPGEI